MHDRSQIEVRLAALDEASAIAEVMLESFTEFRHLYTDGGFAATALKADEIQERMREGPVWVAALGGKIVGTASAVVKADMAYIRGVAALPSVRGLGVGYAMLREAEQFAVRVSCRRLALTTTPFLGAAIRLYEKLGFRRTEDLDLFGTPLFGMEKTLLSH